MSKSALRSGLALGLLFVLAACGGGGGDAPAAPAPVAGPSPSPAPSPAPASTCGLPDFAAASLARLNQMRAAGADCGSSGRFAAAPPVVWNALLTQAADGHSRDMAAQNYFSHTSLDGRSMSARVSATGYAWSSLGENIAAGYGSVNDVMQGWITSPGHCANLMNPGFTEVGMACAPGASGARYSTYWTMNLGRAR
jgi:uncharacterized protein YkwD